MPSGDACQGIIICYFLFKIGINTNLLIIYQIGVCLSRVYFMCHWLGDVMFGSILGLSLCMVI